jgi:pyridoxal phosphate enzyme (YggS family)
MNIRTRLADLKNSLPATCKLIAVTKTQPVESINEAYVAGHRDFGENKVQELGPKSQALPTDIRWHMIGHLQSNKVKYIAPYVHLIHGVDSAKLLDEISKQGKKAGRVIPCLLQVHIAMEETKFGFSEEEIFQLVTSPQVQSLTHVKVAGLMGMATFTDNADQVSNEFRGLKALYDRLRSSSLPANFQLEELSMGMSGDYKLAIAEGSTMVRVGTAIFGERTTSQTTVQQK